AAPARPRGRRPARRPPALGTSGRAPLPADDAASARDRRVLRRPAAAGRGGATMSDPEVTVGVACPECGEPWLRPTNLPRRYRCVYCLRRFELVSLCPNCGQ